MEAASDSGSAASPLPVVEAVWQLQQEGAACRTTLEERVRSGSTGPASGTQTTDAPTARDAQTTTDGLDQALSPSTSTAPIVEAEIADAAAAEALKLLDAPRGGPGARQLCRRLAACACSFAGLALFVVLLMGAVAVAQWLVIAQRARMPQLIRVVVDEAEPLSLATLIAKPCEYAHIFNVSIDLNVFNPLPFAVKLHGCTLGLHVSGMFGPIGKLELELGTQPDLQEGQEAVLPITGHAFVREYATSYDHLECTATCQAGLTGWFSSLATSLTTSDCSILRNAWRRPVVGAKPAAASETPEVGSTTAAPTSDAVPVNRDTNTEEANGWPDWISWSQSRVYVDAGVAVDGHIVLDVASSPAAALFQSEFLWSFSMLPFTLTASSTAMGRKSALMVKQVAIGALTVHRASLSTANAGVVRLPIRLQAQLPWSIAALWARPSSASGVVPLWTAVHSSCSTAGYSGVALTSLSSLAAAPSNEFDLQVQAPSVSKEGEYLEVNANVHVTSSFQLPVWHSAIGDFQLLMDREECINSTIDGWTASSDLHLRVRVPVSAALSCANRAYKLVQDKHAPSFTASLLASQDVTTERLVADVALKLHSIEWDAPVLSVNAAKVIGAQGTLLSFTIPSTDARGTFQWGAKSTQGQSLTLQDVITERSCARLPLCGRTMLLACAEPTAGGARTAVEFAVDAAWPELLQVLYKHALRYSELTTTAGELNLRVPVVTAYSVPLEWTNDTPTDATIASIAVQDDDAGAELLQADLQVQAGSCQFAQGSTCVSIHASVTAVPTAGIIASLATHAVQQQNKILRLDASLNSGGFADGALSLSTTLVMDLASTHWRVEQAASGTTIWQMDPNWAAVSVFGAQFHLLDIWSWLSLPATFEGDFNVMAQSDMASSGLVVSIQAIGPAPSIPYLRFRLSLQSGTFASLSSVWLHSNSRVLLQLRTPVLWPLLTLPQPLQLLNSSLELSEVNGSSFMGQVALTMNVDGTADVSVHAPSGVQFLECAVQLLQAVRLPQLSLVINAQFLSTSTYSISTALSLRELPGIADVTYDGWQSADTTSAVVRLKFERHLLQLATDYGDLDWLAVILAFTGIAAPDTTLQIFTFTDLQSVYAAAHLHTYVVSPSEVEVRLDMLTAAWRRLIDSIKLLPVVDVTAHVSIPQLPDLGVLYSGPVDGQTCHAPDRHSIATYKLIFMANALRLQFALNLQQLVALLASSASEVLQQQSQLCLSLVTQGPSEQQVTASLAVRVVHMDLTGLHAEMQASVQMGPTALWSAGLAWTVANPAHSVQMGARASSTLVLASWVDITLAHQPFVPSTPFTAQMFFDWVLPVGSVTTVPFWLQLADASWRLSESYVSIGRTTTNTLRIASSLPFALQSLTQLLQLVRQVANERDLLVYFDKQLFLHSTEWSHALAIAFTIEHATVQIPIQLMVSNGQMKCAIRLPPVDECEQLLAAVTGQVVSQRPVTVEASLLLAINSPQLASTKLTIDCSGLRGHDLPLHISYLLFVPLIADAAIATGSHSVSLHVLPRAVDVQLMPNTLGCQIWLDFDTEGAMSFTVGPYRWSPLAWVTDWYQVHDLLELDVTVDRNEQSSLLAKVTLQTDGRHLLLQLAPTEDWAAQLQSAFTEASPLMSIDVRQNIPVQLDFSTAALAVNTQFSTSRAIVQQTVGVRAVAEKQCPDCTTSAVGFRLDVPLQTYLEELAVELLLSASANRVARASYAILDAHGIALVRLQVRVPVMVQAVRLGASGTIASSNLQLDLLSSPTHASVELELDIRGVYTSGSRAVAVQGTTAMASLAVEGQVNILHLRGGTSANCTITTSNLNIDQAAKLQVVGAMSCFGFKELATSSVVAWLDAQLDSQHATPAITLESNAAPAAIVPDGQGAFTLAIHSTVGAESFAWADDLLIDKQGVHVQLSLPRLRWYQLRRAIGEPLQRVANGTLPSFSCVVAINGSVGALTYGRAWALKVVQGFDGSLLFGSGLAAAVLATNQAPLLWPTPALQIAENAPAGTLVGNIQVEDDQPQFLRWSILWQSSDAGLFQINPETGTLTATRSLDFEQLSSYQLLILIEDSAIGDFRVTKTQVVAVTNVNEPPSIVAVDWAVSEDTPVLTVVHSMAAVDVDTASSALRWSIDFQAPAPAFDIDAATGAVIVRAALDYEAVQDYTLHITVSDGEYSDSATIHVHVIDVNEAAPVVLAALWHVPENSAAGIAIGTAMSSDADTRQTASWAILDVKPVTGISCFVVNNATGVVYTGACLLNFEGVAEYRLTLQATDSGVPPKNGNATMSVRLLDMREPPTLADHTFHIAENAEVGAQLVPTAEALVQDEDGLSTYFFEILRGNDRAIWHIDEQHGNISVTRSNSLDFEMKSAYVLTVRVTDVGAPSFTSTANFTILLDNINESPMMLTARRTVRENSPVGTLLGPELNATELDTREFAPFGRLAFSIISGNDDGTFALDTDTGILMVAKSQLDFEQQRQYTLTVLVMDPLGLTSSAPVIVDVIDVNEAPVVHNSTRSVLENSPAGTHIGPPLQATDVDAGQSLQFSIVQGGGIFAVDPVSGQLSVHTAALDFEAQHTLLVRVRVTDNGTFLGPLFTDAVVNVTVVDVNEAPVLLPAVRSVEEQQPLGTHVGSPLTCVDPDQTAPWNTLTFSIVSGNEREFFAINDQGQILVASLLLDYEVMPIIYNLVVRVEDHGVPAASAQASVTVLILDINDAPQSNDTERFVLENSSIGEKVGVPVQYSDQDTGRRAGNVTFAIDNDPYGGLFLIDLLTGQITVGRAAINFEAQSEYTLHVNVTDLGNPQLSDTAVIAIHVVDLNDPPSIDSAPLQVPENVANKTYVGRVRVSDEDSGIRGLVSCALLSQSVPSIFAMNHTCHVWVVSATLDFETWQHSDLLVQASDGATPPAFTTQVVRINVQDRNDAPSVATSPLQIYEHADDGSVSLAAYTWTQTPLRLLDVDTPTTPQLLSVTSFEQLHLEDSGFVRFHVNESGYVSVVNGSLNYEANPSYRLRIQVEDAPNPAFPLVQLQPDHQSRNVTVDVMVINVNEKASIVPPSQVTVSEGAAVGKLLLSTEFAFEIVDPDDQSLSLVTFDDYFRFDNITSERKPDGSRAPRYLVVNRPNLAIGTRLVKVQAVDASDATKSSDVVTVVVNVQDVNDPPIMQSMAPIAGKSSFVDDHCVTVPEGTIVGTKIATIVLTDKDLRQSHSYTVSEPYTTYFRVDPVLPSAALLATSGPYAATRQAEVVVIADFLDFESQDLHTFQVCGHDDGKVLNNVVNGVQSLKQDVTQSACASYSVAVSDVDDRPLLLDVAMVSASTGLSTTGGETVTLTGLRLGPKVQPGPTTPLNVSAEYTNGNETFMAESCQVQTAYTAWTCRSVPGFGKGFHWRVTLGNAGRLQTSPYLTSTTMKYAPPSVTGFAGLATLPSTGTHDWILVIGNQFGPKQFSHRAINRVTYGPSGTEYTAQNCSVVQDHVQMNCTMVPGTGTGHQWVVQVGHQESATPTTSYGGPTLDSVRMPSSTLATVGGEIVTLVGTNFGQFDDEIDSVAYGALNVPRSQWYSASSCKIVIAHSQIQCLSAPGAGTNMHWVVTVSGQTSAVSTFQTSYGPPRIDRLALVTSSSGLPTKGDVRVSIQGSNLGGLSANRTVSFGTAFPRLQSVIYISDSELQFTLPAGTGKNKAVQVTVSGQVSNTKQLSYDGPQLSSMKHINGTAGTDIVLSLLGSNFGQCCFARLQQGAGAGGSGEQCDCATDFNGPSTLVQIAGQACSFVKIVSDSEFWCRTRLTSGSVVLVVAGVPSAAYTYDFRSFILVPSITGVACGTASNCTGTFAPAITGGTLVTVTGTAFSTLGVVLFTNGNRELRLAPVPDTYSDTLLQFVAPVGQGSIAIRISVMGDSQQSTSFAMEYRQPEIRSITPLTGPTDGGTDIIMSGDSLGLDAATATAAGLTLTVATDESVLTDDAFQNSVWLGPQLCPVIRYSPTQIVCRAPPGAGTNKKVELRTGRLTKQVPTFVATHLTVRGQEAAWSYLAPTVDALTPNHGPTLGGISVTVDGAGFGTASSVVKVTVDGTEQEITARTHSRITFVLQAGTGADLALVVSVDGQQTTIAFSYDAPVVFSMLSTVDRDLQDPPSLVAACLQQPKATCLNTTFDAKAATLYISGKNFGLTKPDLASTEILVGGTPCTPPSGTDTVWISDSVLICSLPSIRVGRKDVRLRVARQEVLLPAAIRAECRKDFYGKSNQTCTPCPDTGAYCVGGDFEPQAVPGYWKVSNIRFDECTPKASCLGDTRCEVGYEAELCRQCTRGFYRNIVDNSCRACPNNAWLFIFAFVVGISIVAWLFYKIYQARPSIATLAIFTDYMQIMSILGNLNLEWPTPMITFYHAASSATLNIDVASPECSISISYIQKWQTLQLLPVFALLAFAVGHVVNSLRKKFVLRRKGPATKHFHKLMSWWLLIVNILYLVLFKKSVEVFACTDKGGRQYLAVDQSVPCWGPEYESMKVQAGFALFGYGAGIPLLFALLLYGNRHAIRFDNNLRQLGLADSRITNPYYDVHKLLSVLYTKFNPHAFYWAVVVLLRKMAMVAITAQAGANAEFLASATALVLYMSHLAQTKVNPYQSVKVQKPPLRWGVSVTHGTLSQRLKAWAKDAVQSGFTLDPNVLESTCLECCTGILLAAIMHKSIQAQLQSLFAFNILLEWVMLCMALWALFKCLICVARELYLTTHALVSKKPSTPSQAVMNPVDASLTRDASAGSQMTQDDPSASSTNLGATSSDGPQPLTRRKTFRQSMSQLTDLAKQALTVKKEYHYQVAVLSLSLDQIEGLDDNIPMKVKLRLFPSQATVLFDYRARITFFQQDGLVLDGYQFYKDAIHAILCVKDDIGYVPIGFGSVQSTTLDASGTTSIHEILLSDSENKPVCTMIATVKILSGHDLVATAPVATSNKDKLLRNLSFMAGGPTTRTKIMLQNPMRPDFKAAAPPVGERKSRISLPRALNLNPMLRAADSAKARQHANRTLASLSAPESKAAAEQLPAATVSAQAQYLASYASDMARSRKPGASTADVVTHSPLRRLSRKDIVRTMVASPRMSQVDAGTSHDNDDAKQI